jgi:hypothetical protein
MVANVSLLAVIAGIAGWWARAYSCIGCNRPQSELSNFLDFVDAKHLGYLKSKSFLEQVHPETPAA